MSLAKIKYIEAANYYLEMVRSGSRAELQYAETAMTSALQSLLSEQRIVKEDQWESWRPPFSENIAGRFTQREFDEDGLPQPQKVECKCSVCDATWNTTCTSGLVKQHIQRFALLHLHKDPFD